jgi:transcriptional regulator with XRE-family HTH domain
MRIAEQIVALRERAGLTQEQLAKRLKTARSVISRLEDADYHGHSMRMLEKIAAVLNARVEIRFAPLSPPRRAPFHEPPKRLQRGVAIQG